MTLLVLRATHLFFMGLWVGAAMFLGGDVRRAVGAGPENLPQLRDRVFRSLRFNHISAAVTIVSGFALMMQLGPGSVAPTVHVSFVLSLVLAAFGVFGLGGSWRNLDRALKAGADEAVIDRLVLRFGVASASLKTLWALIFALMVFRHVLG